MQMCNPQENAVTRPAGHDETCLERSFHAVVTALNDMPEEEEKDFLARLVLILADELSDADRFVSAVQRARAPQRTEQGA